MVIQINNGYKIKKVSSLKKFKKAIDSIRKEIDKIYYEEYHKEVSILVASILDMKNIGYSDELIREKIFQKYNFRIKNNISVNELILLITKKEFSNNKDLNSHFDFACNLSLYIMDDYILLRIATNKSKLLTGIGYEDTDWIEYSGNLEEVIPWGYDSEDEHPMTISSKEWNERHKDWQYAISNVKPLKIRLNDVIVDYNKQLVLDIINNNFRRRCEDIAEDMIDLKKEDYKNIPKYKVQEEIRRVYTELYISLNNIYTIEDLEKTII